MQWVHTVVVCPIDEQQCIPPEEIHARAAELTGQSPDAAPDAPDTTSLKPVKAEDLRNRAFGCVALVGETHAGHAYLRHPFENTDLAEITTVMVMDGYGGRGIMRRLVAMATAAACSEGWTPVARAAHPAAQHVFKKAGYEEDPDLDIPIDAHNETAKTYVYVPNTTEELS